MNSAPPLARADRDIERHICRLRLLLSLAVFIALSADVLWPYLQVQLEYLRSDFVLGAAAQTAAAVQVLYAATALLALERGWFPPARIAAATLVLDVACALALSSLTGGLRSPFVDLFFGFPLLAMAFRGGLRLTLVATVLIAAAYASQALFAAAVGEASSYMMRTLFLLVMGYFVGSLGQRRVDAERRLQSVEIARQRAEIARDLHDNCVQGLAGVNVRLEACKTLVRSERTEAAIAELTKLQASVTGEYDELRTFMRSLAGVEQRPSTELRDVKTDFRIRVDLDASGTMVEDVMRIMREGIANVCRHAGASVATVSAQSDGEQIEIRIEDDGAGFRDRAKPPWSIASRVSALGGKVRIQRQGQGAHVAISLPRA